MRTVQDGTTIVVGVCPPYAFLGRGEASPIYKTMTVRVRLSGVRSYVHTDTPVGGAYTSTTTITQTYNSDVSLVVTRVPLVATGSSGANIENGLPSTMGVPVAVKGTLAASVFTVSGASTATMTAPFLALAKPWGRFEESNLDIRKPCLSFGSEDESGGGGRLPTAPVSSFKRDTLFVQVSPPVNSSSTLTTPIIGTDVVAPSFQCVPTYTDFVPDLARWPAVLWKQSLGLMEVDVTGWSATKWFDYRGAYSETKNNLASNYWLNYARRASTTAPSISDSTSSPYLNNSAGVATTPTGWTTSESGKTVTATHTASGSTIVATSDVTGIVDWTLA